MLVVCDVDGTLVDKNKQLTDGNVAAVKRLREAGIGFALISARPMSGMRWIAERLDLDTPMAAFNGGTIFHRDGTIDHRDTVTPEVARGVLDLAKNAPVEVWVFADDVWYATTVDGEHVEHERLASSQEPTVRADFADLTGSVDKIVLVSDDQPLLRGLAEQAKARFGDAATVVQSQTYYLDVTAKTGNKGDGIVALAAALQVPLDRTVAVGDQANDLAMFARAGRSIAMGNATDAVKAAATDTTTANDRDGVAHAIDTLILGRMM